jgi:holo-[acyl-carrier protein] synthase
MIIGHGIDLIEINRVSTIYQKFDNIFVDKYFALDKIDKITPKVLSNNFAIKEAFSKSLGLGFRRPCFPKDISVQRDKMGKPEIFPKNELKEYMKEKFGNFFIHVSLSDTKKYSIASVIIEKT